MSQGRKALKRRRQREHHISINSGNKLEVRYVTDRAVDHIYFVKRHTTNKYEPFTTTYLKIEHENKVHENRISLIDDEENCITTDTTIIPLELSTMADDVDEACPQAESVSDVELNTAVDSSNLEHESSGSWETVNQAIHDSSSKAAGDATMSNDVLMQGEIVMENKEEKDFDKQSNNYSQINVDHDYDDHDNEMTIVLDDDDSKDSTESSKSKVKLDHPRTGQNFKTDEEFGNKLIDLSVRGNSPNDISATSISLRDQDLLSGECYSFHEFSKRLLQYRSLINAKHFETNGINFETLFNHGNMDDRLNFELEASTLIMANRMFAVELSRAINVHEAISISEELRCQISKVSRAATIDISGISFWFSEFVYFDVNNAGVTDSVLSYLRTLDHVQQAAVLCLTCMFKSSTKCEKNQCQYSRANVSKASKLASHIMRPFTNDMLNNSESVIVVQFKSRVTLNTVKCFQSDDLMKANIGAIYLDSLMLIACESEKCVQQIECAKEEISCGIMTQGIVQIKDMSLVPTFENYKHFISNTKRGGNISLQHLTKALKGEVLEESSSPEINFSNILVIYGKFLKSLTKIFKRETSKWLNSVLFPESIGVEIDGISHGKKVFKSKVTYENIREKMHVAFVLFKDANDVRNAIKMKHFSWITKEHPSCITLSTLNLMEKSGMQVKFKCLPRVTSDKIDAQVRTNSPKLAKKDSLLSNDSNVNAKKSIDETNQNRKNSDASIRSEVITSKHNATENFDEATRKERHKNDTSAHTSSSNIESHSAVFKRKQKKRNSEKTSTKNESNLALMKAQRQIQEIKLENRLINYEFETFKQLVRVERDKKSEDDTKSRIAMMKLTQELDSLRQETEESKTKLSNMVIERNLEIKRLSAESTKLKTEQQQMTRELMNMKRSHQNAISTSASTMPPFSNHHRQSLTISGSRTADNKLSQTPGAARSEDHHHPHPTVPVVVSRRDPNPTSKTLTKQMLISTTSCSTSNSRSVDMTTTVIRSLAAMATTKDEGNHATLPRMNIQKHHQDQPLSMDSSVTVANTWMTIYRQMLMTQQRKEEQRREAGQSRSSGS